METLIAVQRWICASITADLGTFAASRDWFSLLAILPLGIVFGAVHALTPGHGKSVLATYIIGSRMRAEAPRAPPVELTCSVFAARALMFDFRRRAFF